MNSDLTHFDEHGASRMVDVSEKPVTTRLARAETLITMQPATLHRILQRDLHKGDVIEVARLAAIMGTKRTSELIPLCHPLPIDGVEVKLEPVDNCTLRIEATVKTTARTGVEMEALTAVSIAGLTVYDMCKAIDRGMVIGPTRLLEKSGGRSGHFQSV
ncbi:MAG: cyclic pyranopterin monophosphate synthase accessory protein [Planctomycetaceae bacterium]|nr:MAG: cyclic pyranopterin monophosphate synthase accessory protein [Planctomycetaceae bacterium]